MLQFLRLLSEEFDDDASQRLDLELALSKAVDGLVLDMETNVQSSESKREKLNEYKNQCLEKFSTPDAETSSEKIDLNLEIQQETDVTPLLDCKEPPHQGFVTG